MPHGKRGLFTGGAPGNRERIKGLSVRKRKKKVRTRAILSGKELRRKGTLKVESCPKSLFPPPKMVTTSRSSEGRRDRGEHRATWKLLEGKEKK